MLMVWVVFQPQSFLSNEDINFCTKSLTPFPLSGVPHLFSLKVLESSLLYDLFPPMVQHILLLLWLFLLFSGYLLPILWFVSANNNEIFSWLATNMPLACSAKTMMSINSLPWMVLTCSSMPPSKVSVSIAFALAWCKGKSSSFTKSGTEQFIRPVSISNTVS